MVSNSKNQKPILEIRNLKTGFKIKGNQFHPAVDGIDVDVCAGEVLGLVGESGCGKTVASLSILSLVPKPGLISGGRILWKGKNLLELSHREMRGVRGREVAMIFQNPQAALNPLYTIGHQMRSLINLHRPMSTAQAEAEAVRLLTTVRLSDPEKRLHDYPHQLSGGQCQRVMIAMALSCQPELLIADEPTAALDVTIQAQIMDLLLEIRDRFEMSILLISHDMGVVARMCDRISVMYLGKIVEEASAQSLYTRPKHPYTRALLEAVPIPDPSSKGKVTSIPGDLPSAVKLPTGCRFRTRCPEAFSKCTQVEPELALMNPDGSKVACWLYQ